jgi:RNA polymerase sigma-70 factor, ECF subfamily
LALPPGARVATTADPPDVDLIRAAAAGERAALAVLYDRHAPALLALGQRMLRSRREAEDLLHDVFLEVWRAAGDHDPTRGTVRCWLLMRLRSRALDRLKSAGYARVVSIELGGFDEPSTAPYDPTVSSDHALVRRALADLPVDQQSVLEQAYFEGLSLSEIADRQGVPLGTIKSRLARALGRLREALDVAGGGLP